MNRVEQSGRLTREPEIRHTQGEKPMAVARFTLAVERRFKREGEQNADYIPCVAFGKTAEFVEKYFHQGTKIIVCGHLQSGSYTNQEGKKVYTLDLVADEVEFAESKRDNTTSQNSYSGRPSAPTVDEEGFMNVPDSMLEEMPFA